MMCLVCSLSATGDAVKLEAKTEEKTDSDSQPPEKKAKVMGS